MAFLLEHGYQTNREDCAALMQDEVLEKHSGGRSGNTGGRYSGLVQGGAGRRERRKYEDV